MRIRIGPGPEPEALAAGSESKSAKQPKLSCAQLRGPCPLLIMLPGSGVEARQHGLEGWGGAFILWNVQEDGDVQMLPLLWLGVLRWGVAITGNLIIPNASSDGMCCRRQAATQCFVFLFGLRTNLLSMGMQGQQMSAAWTVWASCRAGLGRMNTQEVGAAHETHRLAARACCSP